MAKKVILIILGILLGLCGIGALCGGGALLGIGGTGGNIQSDFHNVGTSTVGFVSDPARVEKSSNVNASGGSVTLNIDGRNSSKPLFVGVGPTAQVDSYLAGAPYETVTNVDFSPFKLTTSTVDGNAQPAAPGDQSFWVAQATGTTPQLKWKIASGDYELVVMNQDASPQVSLDARVGVKAPVLGGLGLGLLIGGIIVALAGLAVLIWGIRTKRRVIVEPAAAYPGGMPYQPGATYPPAYPGPGPGAGSPPPNMPPSTGWQPGQPGAYPPPDPYAPPASPADTPPNSAPPASGWEPRPPDDPTLPRS